MKLLVKTEREKRVLKRQVSENVQTRQTGPWVIIGLPELVAQVIQRDSRLTVMKITLLHKIVSPIRLHVLCARIVTWLCREQWRVCPRVDRLLIGSY